MAACCVVCTAAATVYCDNDKALLCRDCDVKIHLSNPVAARHTRHPVCEGGCRRGATLFCKCDSAFLCEGCHSSNPLATTHEVEAAYPLPAPTEQEALQEEQAQFAPCESVAQSAASPMAWFVDDEKAHHAFGEQAQVLSPSGSEAVVPVMSVPFEDFDFSAPATFKDIKDKLEFETLDIDNGWMEMGFDFTDILSDAPSDGLVPTLDVEVANQTVADAAVPTYVEEEALPTRTRFADAALQERAAEVPTIAEPVIEVEHEAQVPEVTMAPLTQPAFFFPAMFAQQPLAVVPTPPVSAPAPRGSAYNAALMAGANLTREQRVARYREKRKNRKFEKTIRYASRKAYAEIRPRIKGRFARKEEIEAWKAANGGEDAVVPDVLDGLL